MSIPRYASTPASPSIQQMPELAATTPSSPLPTTAVDILNAPLVSEPAGQARPFSTVSFIAQHSAQRAFGSHFKPSGTLRLGGLGQNLQSRPHRGERRTCGAIMPRLAPQGDSDVAITASVQSESRKGTRKQ